MRYSDWFSQETSGHTAVLHQPSPDKGDNGLIQVKVHQKMATRLARTCASQVSKSSWNKKFQNFSRIF